MVGSEAENALLVVGVGASAGGLDAVNALLRALPPRPGLAVVVVQHLDPYHPSRLVDILRAQTAMPVDEAMHGVKVHPDHVYVIQPNTTVALADGVLSVTARVDAHRPHYPIDAFFRSLAQVQGVRAVGVVLSGTGTDGTLGACEIKAAGGLTFAQDDASAQHAGMPHSAAASGAIDIVLPPGEIARALAALPRHPYLASGDAAGELPATDGEPYQQVIAALRNSSGVDFRQYRDTTIKRRTARRMLLRGVASPAEYARLLEEDPEETKALYRDVLINVTSFFRDPEMFEELKRDVFPALVRERAKRTTIRVWVPACSTGQEAYSLAIALLEFLDTEAAPWTIQIFATDIGDPAALDKARAGVYPEGIESEVTAERLRRFFEKTDGGYRIHKAVRDLCVFARQNLTVDPPFSRVDLVSCRNVLIYMAAALQQRLLPILHFALNPGGFLVLGAAETVGQFPDLFDLVSRTHKIYRKRENVQRPPLSFVADEWFRSGAVPRAAAPGAPPDFQREADGLVLGRYAPPSVLVNLDFEIQQFRGRTAPYLEAPAGQPTTNILRMAKEGLFLDLHSALTEAKATRSPVVREHLHASDAGVAVEFTLRVLPVTVPQVDALYLLVLFERAESSLPSSGTASSGDAPATGAEHDISRLRQELTVSKEYLQSIVEQQEVAGQELRAAHEEVLSSNEELQSTNEELETAKEELQSANEELSSVNDQLHERNRELDDLADDLSNFIASADLPMVTVDRDLRVRRLTPAAQRIFNLLPTDVGRSIEHIKFALNIDAPGTIIAGVIASGAVWEREVTDRDGRWWILRVRPYVAAGGRGDGATVVAVDIDSVKRTHEVIEARDYALAIVQTVREPLVVLDDQLRVGLANVAFYDLFGGTPKETEGEPLSAIANGHWHEPSLQRALLEASTGAQALEGLEVEWVLPGRGPRTLVLNARGIIRTARPRLLLLAVEDVTDRRQAETLRIDAETLRLVNRRKDEFLGILAHELRNPLAPMRFALELLRRSDRGIAEATKPRQVLERQISHMTRIIDDLLDVSRITQGKVELRKESIELKNIVTAAVELCQPSIDAAQHAIAVSLPDEVVRMRADPVRLTQVIINLLNNAVKFTPPGGHIWVIADTVGETAGHPDHVRIRVRDTGIGIADDVRPHIFDMFMQGDRSLERTRGGLGVGLTLARSLVVLHGGQMQVRSKGPGTGSEFIVVLPMDPAEQPASRDADVPRRTRASTPLRILVADDYADAREMLGYVLAAEGHTVTTAADGPSALEAAAAFHPDVAILDIGMPGLNGYDVARRLRLASPRSSLVLVALSGLGQDQDRARALEAGFDHHFTKPVDVHELIDYLIGIGRKDRGSSA